ncbi:MAG: hypothetical protein JWO68_3518, partial [Actinomycetia bacterium]|nr:hypothetical protein [Actinomycetes bacterium]
ADAFIKTLDALGPVKIPNSPFLGDIEFTDAFSMHYAQLWKSDPKNGFKPIAVGDVIKP